MNTHTGFVSATGAPSAVADNEGAELTAPNRIAIIQLGARRKVGVPILFIEEDDGEFSVIAINLPGACAQGATIEKARAAIVPVLEAMLDESLRAGSGIPFVHEWDFSEKGRIATVWLNA